MFVLIGRISLWLLALGWLVYVSPFGIYLCQGLMTHDLPLVFAAPLWNQFFACFFSLVAVPLVALAWWLQHKTRARFLVGLLCSSVAPSLLLWRPDPRPLRTEGLQQAARQMNAVNVALAAHRAKHSSFPASLDELNVSRKTGTVCSPTLHYRRLALSSPSGGYELEVSTSFRFVDFESLIFWPSQSYPASINGELVELVRVRGGTWGHADE